VYNNYAYIAVFKFCIEHGLMSFIASTIFCFIHCNAKVILQTILYLFLILLHGIS